MIRTIKLSKRAAKKLDKLLEYRENEWSLQVKHEFIDKLDKSLKLIQKNPDLFPESTIENGLHKCVLTKQTTIF